MNLNSNPRAENMEVSDDAALADFLEAEVDLYFREQAPGTFEAELRHQPTTGVSAGRATGTRLYPPRAK